MTGTGVAITPRQAIATGVCLIGLLAALAVGPIRSAEAKSWHGKTMCSAKSIGNGFETGKLISCAKVVWATARQKNGRLVVADAAIKYVTTHKKDAGTGYTVEDKKCFEASRSPRGSWREFWCWTDWRLLRYGAQVEQWNDFRVWSDGTTQRVYHDH